VKNIQPLNFLQFRILY